MLKEHWRERLHKLGVQLSPEASLHPQAVIQAEPPVVLGKMQLSGSFSVGRYSYFATGRIGSLRSIGRFCSVAPDVLIGLGEHPTEFLSTHPFQYGAAGHFDFWPEARNFTVGVKRPPIRPPPVIGNDVWIGANVVICRGVTIGDGAIIAAGAVVAGNVAPYEIVGGTPARHIRYRFSPDIVEQLLQVRWWDCTMASLEGVPFDDIRAAVADLQRRREAGLLAAYEPHLVTVTAPG